MSQFQEKSSRSRILHTAKKIFGRLGYVEATMEQVAEKSGVPQKIIDQYFTSKEGLLMETQKAVFRELHRRFTIQANNGESGLHTALDALDAMWQSTRDLKDIAPFMLDTLNLGNKKKSLRPQLDTFYHESTSLLEDGIRKVFAENVATLVIPPQRVAILIRIALSGLLLELSRADSPEKMKEIDQAYADIRSLFEQFILQQEDKLWDEATDSVPLPW